MLRCGRTHKSTRTDAIRSQQRHYKGGGVATVFAARQAAQQLSLKGPAKSPAGPPDPRRAGAPRAGRCQSPGGAHVSPRRQRGNILSRLGAEGVPETPPVSTGGPQGPCCRFAGGNAPRIKSTRRRPPGRQPMVLGGRSPDHALSGSMADRKGPVVPYHVAFAERAGGTALAGERSQAAGRAFGRPGTACREDWPWAGRTSMAP